MRRWTLDRIPGKSIVNQDLPRRNRCAKQVVMHLTTEDVNISLHEACRDGPYSPRVRPRQLASLRWDRLPSSLLWIALNSFIGTGSEMRKATFKTCEHCKQVKPLESMDGGTVCHSCRERVLGIVY
jgi:hypothetical protein